VGTRRKATLDVTGNLESSGSRIARVAKEAGQHRAWNTGTGQDILNADAPRWVRIEGCMFLFRALLFSALLVSLTLLINGVIARLPGPPPKAEEQPHTDSGSKLPAGAIMKLGPAGFPKEADTEGKDQSISSIAFVQQGRLIVLGRGPMISLWDGTSGNLIRRFRDKGEGYALVAVSPDGKILVSSGPDGLAGWEMDPWKLLYRTDRARQGISDLTFVDARRLRVLASGEHGERWTALWDARLGKEVQRVTFRVAHIKAPTHSEGPLTISPNGEFFLSAFIHTEMIPSTNPPVFLWNSLTGQRIRQLGGKEIDPDIAVFSPDSKTLATGGRFTGVQVWEIATGKKRCHFQLPIDDSYMSCAAFSTNCKLLAVGDAQGGIRIFDLTSTKEIRKLSVHGRHVSQLAFSEDGRCLASGHDDATVIVWDVASTGQ
jgi:WD40 repeat protein